MDNRKSNGGTSGGIMAAVAIAGLVDAALVVVLLLLFLAPRKSAERVEASLPVDFVENAEDYGQIDTMTAKYASTGTVAYVGTIPAAQPQTEPEQPQTEPEPPQTEPEQAAEAGNTGQSKYEGFVFPDSDSKVLSDSQIAAGAYNAELCRRAINELYARHGYVFSKQENIDFFSSYDWYRSMDKEKDMNTVYKRFNSTEKKNLKKLKAYEEDNGWG